MRTVRVEKPSGRLAYAIRVECTDDGLGHAMLRDVQRTTGVLDELAKQIHDTPTPRTQSLAYAYVLVDRATMALFDGGTVEIFVSAMTAAKRIAKVIQREVRQTS